MLNIGRARVFRTHVGVSRSTRGISGRRQLPSSRAGPEAQKEMVGIEASISRRKQREQTSKGGGVDVPDTDTDF